MIVVNKMEGHEELLAKQAIVIYSSPTRAMATLHDVERHEVDNVQGFWLLAGQLLTHEALNAIVANLNGRASSRTILPENVLCFEGGRMVWWLPSARREIHFNSADTEFNAAVSGKQVMHPPLVFMAEASKLSLFALPESKRPTAKTPLLRAPYFNLYAAGNMCAGSVLLPTQVSVTDTPRWESAFFGTNFTHSNLHGEQLTQHEGGHNGLWRDMLAAEAFPLDTLCEVKGMTLERWVNS